MLTELHVENYQSIRQADLMLGPVTLIVGPNFSGKSAIIRALYALCFNQTGEEFIQNGQDQTIVSVVGDKDCAVTWSKRRGKSAVYQHGDDHYEKTGAHVPEAIQDVLQIREIQIDSTYSITPQFQKQWDAPLIVGESGSRIARILGKLTRLDVLVGAQMACRRDRERAGREAETAQQELDRLHQQLDALGDVSGLRDQADVILQALDLSRQQAQELELLVELVEKYRRARETVLTDVTGIGEQVVRAGELGQLLTQARQTIALYQRAQFSVTWAGHEAEEAAALVVEKEAAYKKLCEEVGLCETCPLQEVT